MADEICEIKRCNHGAVYTYAAGKGKKQRKICSSHWILHCNKMINLKCKKNYKKKPKY